MMGRINVLVKEKMGKIKVFIEDVSNKKVSDDAYYGLAGIVAFICGLIVSKVEGSFEFVVVYLLIILIFFLIRLDIKSNR